ncbi:MAG: S8 family serine peptidase, partial [Lachnospiraceae bacterium]|nr:S8 family serine peptidase [Lachnospiraceae bacterium]
MRKGFLCVALVLVLFTVGIYPGEISYVYAEDASVEVVETIQVNGSLTSTEELSSVEEMDEETEECFIEDFDGAEESGSIDTWDEKEIKYPEIRVALIDTGIDPTKEILQGHLVDGINESNMTDANGHGTLMAEIIAANTNENVKILPICAFDENGKGTVGATCDAIYKAIEQGADVISLSISGRGSSYLLSKA